MTPAQFDMFAEPKAPPSRAEPTVFRLEDRHSSAEVIVAPLDDGAWGVSTGDHYSGFCGHGFPVHGSYPSFVDALEAGLIVIERHAVSVITDKGSVCSDRHRAFAAKVREWVRVIEAEHYPAEWPARAA